MQAERGPGDTAGQQLRIGVVSSGVQVCRMNGGCEGIGTECTGGRGMRRAAECQNTESR